MLKQQTNLTHKKEKKKQNSNNILNKKSKKYKGNIFKSPWPHLGSVQMMSKEKVVAAPSDPHVVGEVMIEQTGSCWV